MNSTSRLPAEKISYLFCIVICLILAVVICSGCQNLGSGLPGVPGTTPITYNEDLATMIKEITKDKGQLPNATFRAVPDSPKGICEFQTTPGNINTIANAFDMTEIPDVKTLQYMKFDQRNSGLASQFGKDELMRAYGVFGKPYKLKCSKSGRQFEYMIIFYKPQTNEATIETSYAK